MHQELRTYKWKQLSDALFNPLDGGFEKSMKQLKQSPFGGEICSLINEDRNTNF